jgi:hypothetical protein
VACMKWAHTMGKAMLYRCWAGNSMHCLNWCSKIEV